MFRKNAFLSSSAHNENPIPTPPTPDPALDSGADTTSAKSSIRAGGVINDPSQKQAVGEMLSLMGSRKRGLNDSEEPENKKKENKEHCEKKQANPGEQCQADIAAALSRSTSF